MSAAKRAASNSFGNSQLVVKRQKSDANLRNGREVAVANGSAANGALIQTVSVPHSSYKYTSRQRVLKELL